MLLSRTAEDLYWLGRNMERAESVSRIVGEHTSLLVDLPVDVESDWAALLAITGSEQLFTDRYDAAGETEVITFLMADVGNPGSVLRSVNAAREGLRVSRQLVPHAAWECINRLHLTAADTTAGCTVRTTRMSVTESVITTCQQFVGVMAGTMNRDHAYRFWELGRLIERADMTTRVLDVRAGTLMTATAPTSHPPADRSPYEDVRWLGVLRALGAHTMYHRSTATSVRGDRVVEFLLDDADFPRSVRHCSDQIERLLSELPERPELFDALGSLRSTVADRAGGPVDATAMHAHVDDVQRSLLALSELVSSAYFAVPAPTPRDPAAVGR